MKVVEISKPGGPEVLTLAERSVPEPKAGEVLVKVAATGVNGPDLMQRKGLYPAPAGASDLLGIEIAGEVTAVGEGVIAARPAEGASTAAAAPRLVLVRKSRRLREPDEGFGVFMRGDFERRT